MPLKLFSLSLYKQVYNKNRISHNLTKTIFVNLFFNEKLENNFFFV